jgi:hypothetical protein
MLEPEQPVAHAKVVGATVRPWARGSSACSGTGPACDPLASSVTTASQTCVLRPRCWAVAVQATTTFLDGAEMVALQLDGRKGLCAFRQVRDGRITAARVGQRDDAGCMQEIVGCDVQFPDRHPAAERIRRQLQNHDAKVARQVLAALLVEEFDGDVRCAVSSWSAIRSLKRTFFGAHLRPAQEPCSILASRIGRLSRRRRRPAPCRRTTSSRSRRSGRDDQSAQPGAEEAADLVRQQGQAEQRGQVANAEQLADDGRRRRHGGQPGEAETGSEDVESQLGARRQQVSGDSTAREPYIQASTYLLR